jgi:beta-barrel assembly-enhancing protease
MKFIHFLIIPLTALLLAGCKKNNPSDGSINLFSIEDDIKLGQQVQQEIESKPGEYPVLKEADYPAAYQYMNKMRNKLLASGKVFYRDKFSWPVKIIRNDSVLNAFCAPGGYIYVYTGLIKYLDSEHQLAGVLGHEIAHADRRHSTDQLTKIYGISLLLQVVLGKDSSTLANIAASLVTLKFSRDNERESDEYSVRYLCPTDYPADGAAAFFEKLQSSGSGNGPEFLSTHPDPGDRVKSIQDQKISLGCMGNNTYTTEYQAFKQSLP